MRPAVVFVVLLAAAAAKQSRDSYDNEAFDEINLDPDEVLERRRRDIDEFDIEELEQALDRKRRALEEDEPYEDDEHPIEKARRDDPHKFEPLDVEEEDEGDLVRRKRNVNEGPYEEHIRVKRKNVDYEQRSADYVRRPRHVHPYEVREDFAEPAPSAAPYEQMLAASAEHYHRVYAAPGAPSPAKYLDPDVSGLPVQFVYRPPVPSDTLTAPVPHYIHDAGYSNHNPVKVAPVSFGRNVTPVKAAYKKAPVSPVSFVPINVASVNVAPSSAVSKAQAAIAPIPAESVPLSAPLLRLAGDDQTAAGAHHHHHKGHSKGGGHDKHENHHGAHGGKTTKGFHHEHHEDKGNKGHKTKHLHKTEYDEAQGAKKKHHDNADHKGDHEEKAHGHRGSKFAEKKGHKKGHKTKGYHNKYHKDEFHKEHKFYDDFHKSGEHHRYGKFNAKHASNESGKKKAHHVNAGHDIVEKGKKGYSNKGHLDSDHKGHNGKHGHEEHHHHEEHHAKKGGKGGGKDWGYEKKH